MLLFSLISFCILWYFDLSCYSADQVGLLKWYFGSHDDVTGNNSCFHGNNVQFEGDEIQLVSSHDKQYITLVVIHIRLFKLTEDRLVKDHKVLMK